MTRKAPTVCRAATIDADNNVKNKAFINLGFIPIVLEWFSSKNETIKSFHLMHNIKREQKPIIPTWIISSKEIARILPIIMVWTEIDMGLMEIMNNPNPKKDVKIIPITASTFRPERSERKSLVPAAMPPEIKAPKAKGIPIAYAIATPGTTEWDNASPINDQPFSIKKEDRNAQTIPTNVETHIAFII